MIKIYVEKPDDLEKEYCDKVLDNISKRIEVFLATLSHLLGGAIKVNDPQFVMFKATTRKAINIIEELNLQESDFEKSKYDFTVTSFLGTSKKLASVNIKGLNDFLLFLLKNNNEELKKLILCKPENLKTTNDFILKNYKLNYAKEKELLELAFSYSYPIISDDIKDFFRKTKHIKVCPYCNLENVIHIPTPFGGVARHHELDHFFDQSNYSLLSCSMYNLIPSDSICNGASNKGTTPFNDEYYLNPYISGFDNSISYRPVDVSPEYDVKRIILKVNETNASRLNQLVGSGGGINESTKEGNINVFRLESKYSIKNKDASKILKKINNNHKNFPSLWEILSLMNLQSSKEVYLNWYELYIGTPFKNQNFGDEISSKFNRDMHDYYYEKNKKSWFSRHIYELIETERT